MDPGKKIKSETFLPNPFTVANGVSTYLREKPMDTKNPDRSQGCLWFETF